MRRYLRTGKSPRGQQGFAMFELVLAIMIASILGVWAASAWMRQVEDAGAQATGAWMLGVKKGVDQMIKRQSDSLTGIADLTGADFHYQDVWRPTITELIQAGHLPQGFPHQPPTRYHVAIRVFEPVGDCLGKGCKIEALTYARPEGLRAAAEASDTTRIGKIIQALEGSGASAHPLKPDRLRGAQVDLPNPPAPDMASLPPGSIVARSFYDSSLLAHFIRQKDKRETRLEAPLSVKESIASDGNLQAGAGILAGGRISSGEYLQVQGQATNGGPCDAEGLIGREFQGGLTVCTKGRWQGSGSRFGGVFTLHGMYGCDPVRLRSNMTNPLTGWCTCPESFYPVQISSWALSAGDDVQAQSFVCLK